MGVNDLNQKQLAMPETDNNLCDAVEQETLTAIAFSPCGEYLATGNNGGEVHISKFDSYASDHQNKHSTYKDYTSSHHTSYQSHLMEFDFLKSVEIEEKINQLQFCRLTSSSQSIISSNDKTIKIWKLASKPHRKRYASKAVESYKNTGSLVFPSRIVEEADSSETYISAKEDKVFKNAHAYAINSLSLNSDCETFISADDLRINWWNLDISDTCFQVVDIKPDSWQELNQVITSAHFHPRDSRTLMYSTSRGHVKVYDTRDSALLGEGTHQVFECEEKPNKYQQGFISDILKSISHATYSGDGRYIITRSYLSVNIWDTHMSSKKPLKTVHLHENLRPFAYKLYTTDDIFDKFRVACSYDGKSIATGSYDSELKLFNWETDFNEEDGGDPFIHTCSVPPAPAYNADLLGSVSEDTVDTAHTSDTANTASASLIHSRSGSLGNHNQNYVSVQKHRLPYDTLISKSRSSIISGVTDRSRSYSSEIDDEGLSPQAGRSNYASRKSNVSIECKKIKNSSVVDVDQKVLLCAWHPKQYIVATAVDNDKTLHTYQL